jgi:HK97 family phage portal protein
MNVFGWNIGRERKSDTLTLDQFINRMEALWQTMSGIVVTPDTALEAPTVQAIDQAISGTIATLPVRVLQKSTDSQGRETKEHLTSHPVAKLLNKPSDSTNRVTYWLDAASYLVRYGNHYAVKARGITGPIRRLESVPPCYVQVEQQKDRRLLYRVTADGQSPRDYPASDIHHARGRAKNGYKGDSPVHDVREAIAMEIAAERFGAAFFGNGALPGIIFNYMAASPGHQTQQQRDKFLSDFKQAFGGKGRFSGMILPKGMEYKTIDVENDKAQFLETRKHQQVVIAGAFNVPPHLVGNLERGTFSNIEHQSIEFFGRVVLRYVRMFEAAMENDLLTPEDRNAGICIRFNLDGALRGDFKSRQEGLKIMRENGVINPNEWREHENMNPRTDPGGDEYWDEGPSGQNQGVEPGAPKEGSDNATGTA